MTRSCLRKWENDKAPSLIPRSEVGSTSRRLAHRHDHEHRIFDRCCVDLAKATGCTIRIHLDPFGTSPVGRSWGSSGASDKHPHIQDRTSLQPDRIWQNSKKCHFFWPKSSIKTDGIRQDHELQQTSEQILVSLHTSPTVSLIWHIQAQHAICRVPLPLCSLYIFILQDCHGRRDRMECRILRTYSWMYIRFEHPVTSTLHFLRFVAFMFEIQTQSKEAWGLMGDGRKTCMALKNNINRLSWPKNAFQSAQDNSDRKNLWDNQV